MPTVGVYKDELQVALDRKIEKKEFEDVCFQYGLELDEETTEFEQIKNERGADAAKAAAGESADVKARMERLIWKVDIPANRYDLLCIEGLTQALQIFDGIKKAPTYKMLPQKEVMYVKKEVAQVRKFVVSAVLRDISFTKESYESFIDLQEKLHVNICRRRSLVAIGTHDLDTIEGPFTYEALPPKDINFVPLKDPIPGQEGVSYDAKSLLEGYEGVPGTDKKGHAQLREYVKLIKDSPVYPVIYDKNRKVLSLPPIINGDHSKITLNTKNVFIECTARDHTKAKIVLNTICAMFSTYTNFQVEPVKVVYEKDYPADVGDGFVHPGDEILYPQMEPYEMISDAARMKKDLGLEELPTEDVTKLLGRMMLPVEPVPGFDEIMKVSVPCTRSDVMHECDLVEDLAIAYGYNNLTHKNPEMYTHVAEQPLNKLTDAVRMECAMAGFNECLNFGLCAYDDCFKNMKKEPIDISELRGSTPIQPTSSQPSSYKYKQEYNLYLPPVTLSNPKAKEFNIVRTTLLASLLKTLEHNKSMPLPLHLFEVSDVVVRDNDKEVGARNERRCAALICDNKSSFETIHGLIDHVLIKLGCRSDVALKEDALAADKAKAAGHPAKKPFKGKVYALTPGEDPMFLAGMCANIVIEDTVIGVAGVLRPDVCDPPMPTDGGKKAWSLRLPVTCMEFNVEPFLRWLNNKNLAE